VRNLIYIPLPFFSDVLELSESSCLPRNHFYSMVGIFPMCQAFFKKFISPQSVEFLVPAIRRRPPEKNVIVFIFHLLQLFSVCVRCIKAFARQSCLGPLSDQRFQVTSFFGEGRGARFGGFLLDGRASNFAPPVGLWARLSQSPSELAEVRF